MTDPCGRSTRDAMRQAPPLDGLPGADGVWWRARAEARRRGLEAAIAPLRAVRNAVCAAGSAASLALSALLVDRSTAPS